MAIIKRASLLLLALLTLQACSIFDRDEDPVSILHVNEALFSVRSNGLVEGSPSANIDDVWLEVNGQVVGTYELPVDIPILATGPTDIFMFAGVKRNGIGADRARYPFYSPIQTTLVLDENSTLDFTPEFTYIEDRLEFQIEDFESAGSTLVRSLGSDTTINDVADPIPNEALRGLRVGKVVLGGNDEKFKIQSTFDLDLALEENVYIELDYLIDAPITVGLLRTSPTYQEVSVIGLAPKQNAAGDYIWNKVYIDLRVAIDQLGNLFGYEIFIEGNLNGRDEATYYLDNVKVINPS